MTRPQPRYKPGDCIGGRYQVHKALMGGMGEVYLCLDLEAMQPYALKTFQKRYVTDTHLLRVAFEQEVVTWVALEKHPNIVRCFYMVALDNQPFTVLEWISGEEGHGIDLRSWLRHGPLDLKLALEIGIDICRGLIYAQQKVHGLIHCDLKPENILISQGQVVKITDFGLAQIVVKAGLDMTIDRVMTDSHQNLIGRQDVVGTPNYMPLEQWHGGELDCRADIYAIGCILYEMFTGRIAFQASSLEGTYRQHLKGIPRLNEWNLPNVLNVVLIRCLAKQREDRFATINELLAQLILGYREIFDIQPPVIPTINEFSAIDYANRGNTYRLLHQYEKALIDFDQSLRIDPNLALVYSNRGLLYHELQKYKEALHEYSQALQIEPRLIEAYVNSGITYAKLQQYDKALDSYQQASQLDPNSDKVYSNRGLTYHYLREYENALVDYNRAILLNPENAIVYANRGLTYYELGQYKEALVNYNQAIQLDPTMANVHLQLGYTHLALNNYQGALTNLSNAIQIDPSSEELYYTRGQIYEILGQYNMALMDFDRVIQINANHPLVYSHRGEIYYQLQHYEQAVSEFDRTIQVNPHDSEVYVKRGFAHYKLIQYNEALDDARKVIQLKPNHVLAYSLQGMIYTRLQQYGIALTSFNQAVQLNPSAQTFFDRALCYEALHRYEEALVDYDQAIKFNPHLIPAYGNAGIILGNFGRLREALFYFEKVVELGDKSGERYVILTKQMLANQAVPQTSHTQLAFEAFQKVNALIEMRVAVKKYQFMTHTDFIVAIEQAIAHQVPSQYRIAFEQRLAWLRQIASEQNAESTS